MTVSSFRIVHALMVAVWLAPALPAAARSWPTGGAGPNLGQLVAVDATGEPEWPFGSEDLAGNGAEFASDEQAVDLRSAYAKTDDQALWVRVYVSAGSAPSAGLRAFVFVDADNSMGTGGGADASAVEAAFTTDPSPGGYDYVFAVQADSTVVGLWEWDARAGQFVDRPAANRAGAEVGIERDPLRLNGDDHGYLQARVELSAVGLTETCNAKLFVRSVNGEADEQQDDLELGGASFCAPPDNDHNGVPDWADRPECTSDEQCIGGGVCINSECVTARGCAGDADCSSGERCSADRLCIAEGGGACSTAADCDGLVCVNDECRPCSEAACPAGSSCGPGGRCVAGQSGGGEPAVDNESLIDEAAGEEVRGGACSCSLPRRSPGPCWFCIVAAGAVGLLLARRNARA